MASRQLLEIDSSILAKNLIVNEDYLNIPDDPLKLLSSQESPDFKLVKPSPGFCVKFKLANDQKVFMNVCHTEELPAPRDITEEELAEIIQSEELSDFKIPMSIGDPHEEVDKSGGPATVYDIAISSKFFAKIKDSRSFKFLFLMIAIEGVEAKYEIELNQNYTVLKNRSCLGNLQYHRIRQTQAAKPEKKAKCLIEELPSSELQAGNKRGTQSPAKKNRSIQDISSRSDFSGKEQHIVPVSSTKIFNPQKLVDYRVMELDTEGRKFYVVEVYLPNIISSRVLSLNVGEDRLLLSSKKGSVLVDTFFKANVKENECISQFNTKCQVLTVTVPVA